MKFFSFLILTLFAGIFLISCQKEYSLENNNSAGNLLTDAIGDCLPISVQGSYVKDSVLKTANFVEVQVEFTTPGAYTLSTDTVNGYSFRGSGAANAAGITTVRLLGSGKPITASAADVFQIRYDSSACDFTVVVSATPPTTTTAVFTLGGSPGACTGATTNGTYTQGVATTSANTAVINVNATTPGTYSINTAAVNGVTFLGNGTLVAGAQTITLTASGMPGASGSFDYPLSAGGSNCTFSVNYGAGTPPATYTIDCAGATLAGTYQQNTPTTSSNTVTIAATSTGAGSYNITTPAVNGVTFSGTGTFAAAGTQPIVLTASGNPAASGPFTYPATAATGGSTCNFSVTYTGGTPPPTEFITATVGGVAKTFNTNITATFDNSTGFALLLISGENAAGTEFIDFSIALTGTSIPQGTYTVSNMTYGVDANYENSAGDVFSAQTGGSNPTPAFKIITSAPITATSTTASGSFDGALKDVAGTVIAITNGSFNVNL